MEWQRSFIARSSKRVQRQVTAAHVQKNELIAPGHPRKRAIPEREYSNTRQANLADIRGLGLGPKQRTLWHCTSLPTWCHWRLKTVLARLILPRHPCLTGLSNHRCHSPVFCEELCAKLPAQISSSSFWLQCQRPKNGAIYTVYYSIIHASMKISLNRNKGWFARRDVNRYQNRVRAYVEVLLDKCCTCLCPSLKLLSPLHDAAWWVEASRQKMHWPPGVEFASSVLRHRNFAFTVSWCPCLEMSAVCSVAVMC